MSPKITIIKEVKCTIGTISLRSDKILIFKPFNSVDKWEMKALKEMYHLFMEITGGVPHLYYSDNTNLKSFGAEERAYICSTFHHFALACAIIENSALIRFLTHYMMYLNKPKIPLALFKKEADAILWLKSLKFD